MLEKKEKEEEKMSDDWKMDLINLQAKQLQKKPEVKVVKIPRTIVKKIIVKGKKKKSLIEKLRKLTAMKPKQNILKTFKLEVPISLPNKIIGNRSPFFREEYEKEKALLGWETDELF